MRRYFSAVDSVSELGCLRVAENEFLPSKAKKDWVDYC